MFVFINRKLAVDLGGVHPEQGGSVYLDNLDLTIGENYELQIFHAERQCCGSNFKAETTILVGDTETCPNQCFAPNGQGVCNIGTGQCMCCDGWSGIDCNTVGNDFEGDDVDAYDEEDAYNGNNENDMVVAPMAKYVADHYCWDSVPDTGEDPAGGVETPPPPSGSWRDKCPKPVTTLTSTTRTITSTTTSTYARATCGFKDTTRDTPSQNHVTDTECGSGYKYSPEKSKSLCQSETCSVQDGGVDRETCCVQITSTARTTTTTTTPEVETTETAKTTATTAITPTTTVAGVDDDDDFGGVLCIQAICSDVGGGFSFEWGAPALAPIPEDTAVGVIIGIIPTPTFNGAPIANVVYRVKALDGRMKRHRRADELAFAVDAASGEVSVAVPLDWETAPLHTFTVGINATLSGGPVLTPEVSVTVDIAAVPCSTATFSETGTFPCLEYTECAGGADIELVPATPTTDRLCTISKSNVAGGNDGGADGFSAAAADQDQPEDATTATGGIIGGALGALGMLLLLIAILYKQKSEPEKDSADEMEAKAGRVLNAGGAAFDVLAVGGRHASGTDLADYTLANGNVAGEYMDSAGVTARAAAENGEQTYDMAAGDQNAHATYAMAAGNAGEQTYDVAASKAEATYQLATGGVDDSDALYAFATAPSSTSPQEAVYDLGGNASGDPVYELGNNQDGGSADPLYATGSADGSTDPVYALGSEGVAPGGPAYAVGASVDGQYGIALQVAPGYAAPQDQLANYDAAAAAARDVPGQADYDVAASDQGGSTTAASYDAAGSTRAGSVRRKPSSAVESVRSRAGSVASQESRRNSFEEPELLQHPDAYVGLAVRTLSETGRSSSYGAALNDPALGASKSSTGCEALKSARDELLAMAADADGSALMPFPNSELADAGYIATGPGVDSTMLSFTSREFALEMKQPSRTGQRNTNANRKSSSNVGLKFISVRRQNPAFDIGGVEAGAGTDAFNLQSSVRLGERQVSEEA